MIRRNAQKGIQIARRGYLSFIEKGNIGVVNYTQTGTTGVPPWTSTNGSVRRSGRMTHTV